MQPFKNINMAYIVLKSWNKEKELRKMLIKAVTALIKRLWALNIMLEIYHKQKSNQIQSKFSRINVHVIWKERRMSKLVLNVKYLLLLSFLTAAEFYNLGHIQVITRVH